MSQKKTRKNVVVDSEKFLGGIQALNIFYSEKIEAYTQIREQYGDEHPVTLAMFDELDTLSSILNFFSELAGTQLNKGEGEKLN